MTFQAAAFIVLMFLSLRLNETNAQDECILNVTSATTRPLMYNLESLNRNMKFMLTEKEKNLPVFVNLCNPLGEVKATNCSPSAFICLMEQEKKPLVIANKRLRINGNRSIISIEMGGDPCSEGRHFFAVVQLICTREQSVPEVKFNRDQCQMDLLWPTPAACPDEEVTVGQCSIMDVDLSPLRSPSHWSLQAANSSFEFNICGPVKGGKCSTASVCVLIANASHPAYIAYPDKMQLVHEPDNSIRIYYTDRRNSVTGARKVEIHLRCAYEKPGGQPVIRYGGILRKRHIIIVESPAACILGHYDCSTVESESGDLYDLNSLSKRGPLQIRESGTNNSYILSLCSPINSKYNGSLCTGPGISVCYVTQNNTPISVYGMMGPKPKFLKDGEVYIEYSNGDWCLNGSERYKTIIYFKCGKVGGNGLYKVEYAGREGCTISINVTSSVACRSKSVKGSGCLVQDPQYKEIFDLQKLYRHEGDFTISLESGETFSINICKGLKDPCHGSRNTSVCLRSRDGEERRIGPIAEAPVYMDGNLQFELQGEPCYSNRNTTVVILLLCMHGYDHGTKFQDDHTGPEYLSSHNCTYYFMWRTHRACPRFAEISKCYTSFKGREYNLNALSNPESNHVIQLRNGTAKSVTTYIINVCRSVVFGSDAVCPPLSGICMMKPASTEEGRIFLNLGDVERGPFFDESGHLRLNFSKGDLCVGSPTQSHHSASVKFICDKNNSLPVLSFEDACHHEFTWRTPYACPTVNPIDPYTGNDVTYGCKYRGFPDKKMFAAFSNKIWVVEGKTPTGNINQTFYVAICRPLKELWTDEGGCSSDTAGACMKDSTGYHNIGEVTYNLQPGGSLLIDYTKQDLCGENDYFHRTEIKFQCIREPGAQPYLQHSGSAGCKHIFVFHTSEACLVADNCLLPLSWSSDPARYTTVSLSKLKTKAPYRIDTERFTFFLSVCNILPAEWAQGTCENTFACMYTRTDAGTLINPKALGEPGRAPRIVRGFQYRGEENVRIDYVYGDVCQSGLTHDDDDEYGFGSATMIIDCDKNAGFGKPKLTSSSEDNCHHHFEWKSNTVCYDRKVDYSPENCSIQNNLDVIPLSILYAENVVKEMMMENSHPPPITAEKMYVYLCPWSTHWMDEKYSDCRNMTVCLEMNNRWIGYGHQNEHFSYYDRANNTVKIFFHGTHQRNCSDKEVAGAEIWFPCTAETGPVPPKLLAATDCHAIIEWPTQELCREHHAPNLYTKYLEEQRKKIEEKQGDSSSSTGVWETVAVIVLLIVMAVAAVVYRRTSVGTAIRRRVGNLWGHKHTGLVQYTSEPRDEWSD